MDNLNCKMQAYARVCEENIELELEEKTTPIETILRLYRCKFKGSYRKKWRVVSRRYSQG